MMSLYVFELDNLFNAGLVKLHPIQRAHGSLSSSLHNKKNTKRKAGSHPKRINKLKYKVHKQRLHKLHWIHARCSVRTQLVQECVSKSLVA